MYKLSRRGRRGQFRRTEDNPSVGALENPVEKNFAMIIHQISPILWESHPIRDILSTPSRREDFVRERVFFVCLSHVVLSWRIAIAGNSAVVLYTGKMFLTAPAEENACFCRKTEEGVNAFPLRKKGRKEICCSYDYGSSGILLFFPFFFLAPLIFRSAVFSGAAC